MPALGSAPTKLLLFGEHAAVYGYPALGIPLPWKLHVSLSKSKRMEWEIAPKYHSQLNPILENLNSIFPEIESHFRISVKSDAPIGMGFGSSGALCVALTRAISTDLKLKLTNQEIWLRAHLLETHFHAHPSGVDTGISTWEQESYFLKNRGALPDYHPIQPVKTPLIVGAFSRLQNTAQLVSSLKERIAHSPELMEYIKELGTIAKNASTILNNAQQFADLANQAQSLLKKLGLSSPELDQVLARGIECGALGGKLSGAGGGGAYYLVCADILSAEQVLSRLNFPHSISPHIILSK